MGYYTEFKFSCQLSKDAPLDLLDQICNGNYIVNLFQKYGINPAMYSVDSVPPLPINHPFGNTVRWESVLGNAIFNKKRKTLKINCELKAYDKLYDKLIDWLSPFIVSGTASIKGETEDKWFKIYNK